MKNMMIVTMCPANSVRVSISVRVMKDTCEESGVSGGHGGFWASSHGIRLGGVACAYACGMWVWMCMCHAPFEGRERGNVGLATQRAKGGGRGYLGRDLQVLDELAVGEEGAEGEPVLNLVDGVAHRVEVGVLIRLRSPCKVLADSEHEHEQPQYIDDDEDNAVERIGNVPHLQREVRSVSPGGKVG